VIHFTLGPVQQPKFPDFDPPYHRSEQAVNELQDMKLRLLGLVNAPLEAKCYVIPGSGTSAMEAAARSLLGLGPVFILDDGRFGNRWAKICLALGHTAWVFHSEHELFDALTKWSGDINILLNHCETSTGRLHMIPPKPTPNSRVIVDCMSTIICEDIYMKSWGADAIVFSSCKGLAADPGLAFVVTTVPTMEMVSNSESKIHDLRWYEAGQPTTYSTRIVQQINWVLNHDDRNIAKKATYFRNAFDFNPLQANCVTTFPVTDALAYKEALTQAGIELSNPENDLQRVSHMGFNTLDEYNKLIDITRRFIRV